MFPGPKDRCLACGLPVYMPEKVMTKGLSYHRACFKCSRGGCPISLDNHQMRMGDLYCAYHGDQAHKESGDDTIRISDSDLRNYVNKTGCPVIFALPQHVYKRGHHNSEQEKRVSKPPPPPQEKDAAAASQSDHHN